MLTSGRHDRDDSIMPGIELVLALEAAGRRSEARREAAAVLRLDPKFTAREWLLAPHYRDAEPVQRESAALRGAGFSD